MGCSSSSSKDEGSGGRSTSSKILGSNDKEKQKNAAKAENKTYQQKLQFLSQVQLFKRLPKEQLPVLAATCTIAEFKPKQTIIKQGDPGAEFYVIKSGEAGVWVVKGDGQPAIRVATLKSGDYFGENALLRDEPRSASISADGAMVTFKITRDQFQGLGLQQHLHFANRKAVGGGGLRVVETKPPSEKTPEEADLIASALRSNANLNTLVTLDNDSIDSIVKVTWKELVPAGKEIITQGDLSADYFYIVQDGSFEIFATKTEEEGEEEDRGKVDAVKSITKNDKAGGDNAQKEGKAAPSGSSGGPKSEGKGGSKTLCVMGPGNSFGELALLYLVPRAASVMAKESSLVWVIDRNNFKNILMKVSDKKINDFVKWLDRVQVLESLLADEKKALARAMIEMHFTKDEVILQQGEPGNTFYVLFDGEVEVIKDGRSEVRLTADREAGTAQFFGERSLLNNEPRAATVRVTSEKAKALALDRDSFNMLLGPLEDIIKKSQGAKSGKRRSQVDKGKRGQGRRDDPERPRILRKDLARVGLLGCGGFGAVELWVHRDTGESYAMKGLSKGFVVKTGMQESVMNEKNILMMTNSSFIVKLYETYNGTQMLYFLMEPALGGELYSTYNRKGFHGSEQHAMFYSAGVVLGFEHMHERRIIYRDLKPENLLLTEKGHLKITDMGLAKFVIGKTYTTCGTPDYFAPELIDSSGHTNAVDWWSLGVLVFELMAGHPPFESTYPMQTYTKVMKGINKVTFPQACLGPVGDLVKALLKKEPCDRLPCRPGGTQNLKDHKYYAPLSWEQMESLDFEAPYVPTVKSKRDIANFQAKKEDMPRHIEYHDDGTGWDQDFATV